MLVFYASGCVTIPSGTIETSSLSHVYPKVSDDANVVITLRSNIEKTNFYIDGKFVVRAKLAKVLINGDAHTIVAKPDNYSEKEYYIQPPYDGGNLYSFYFLKEDKEDNPPPEPDISINFNGPTIIIFEPDISRAIHVVASDEIKIRGKATDADGISKVTVNDIEAQLDKEGFFSALVSLTNDESIILVKATDNKMITTEKSFTINRTPKNVDLESNNAEKRLALVIGNADYKYTGVLTNPINDARAIKNALEELGFEVIKYENSNQEIMKRAIDDFGNKLKNYTVALFFYAGHGVQVNGNNYLIPVDVKLENENDVEYDAVRADRVLAKMESAGTNTNIVILDACRDNPFQRSWRRGVSGRGLAMMDAPMGSIISYATSPGKTASENVGENNGLYTSAILRNIRTPNITIEEMFKRVRSIVIDESNNSQIPWESTSLKGNFYFLRK